MVTAAAHRGIARLLLGTRNPAKIAIVRAALAPLPLTLLTLHELEIDVEVVEDGRTTQENAVKKARAYLAVSGIPTLAIDGALHVAAFSPDRQPGVYVRRIRNSGGEATDQDVLDYYRRELAMLGRESDCTWTGSAALVLSHDRLLVDTFSYRARFTASQKGGLTPGAPLDALTVDPATGKYYTELAWHERPDARWIFEFVAPHVSHG